MHGIIHVELKNFVLTRHGGLNTWQTILVNAGLNQKRYISLKAYPDEEAVAIVKTISQHLNRTVDDVYEEFGLYMAPKLINMYKMLIKSHWKTMELLLNTEETIHRVVRRKNPGARPPQLRFEQTGPNTLKFHYDSPRKMAAVAKGIMRGVAVHYNEKISIVEQILSNGTCEIDIEIMPNK